MQPVQAITNTPLDCPGVVTAPGGYKLTHDTDCGDSRILWNDNNKILDLGGFIFKVAGMAIGGSGNTGNGIKITNGTLYTKGIWWTGGAGTLTNLVIESYEKASPTSTAFLIEAGSKFTVNKCTFLNFPHVALDFYWGLAGATVRNSLFMGNGVGIAIERGGLTEPGMLVQNNTFINNSTGVLIENHDFAGVNNNTISYNVFQGNDIGVDFDAKPPLMGYASMQGNRIMNNRFLANRYAGMLVDVQCATQSNCPGQNTLIKANQVDHNGYKPTSKLPNVNDGIKARGYIGSSKPQESPYKTALNVVTLTNNKAVMNASLGFDVDGVIDGGGNIAKFNGNAVQCIGLLDCGPSAISGVNASSRGSEDAIEPALAPDSFKYLRNFKHEPDRFWFERK